jgi:protease-4
MEAVSQGRVWLGSQAKERGLVDELGGLDTALAALRKKANIGAAEPVNLVLFPARHSIVDVLLRRSAQEDMLETKLSGILGRVPFRAWLRGGYLRVMPSWLEVR